MRKLLACLLMLFFMFLSTSALAFIFGKTGKITRTLSDSENFGQCMILIDTSIENGCPSRWLSLDCEGTYVGTDTGERNYATALMAASLGKSVYVVVDNNARHNNFCVAKRLDVVF